MTISARRIASLREHIRAESTHDIDALIGGMTPDCFNDVVGAPEPFVGPARTAERYRKHWEGFPDFTVRVRRILCADDWEGYPLRKDYVFPREYHGIPASVELDWQQKPSRRGWTASAPRLRKWMSLTD